MRLQLPILAGMKAASGTKSGSMRARKVGLTVARSTVYLVHALSLPWALDLGGPELALGEGDRRAFPPCLGAGPHCELGWRGR